MSTWYVICKHFSTRHVKLKTTNVWSLLQIFVSGLNIGTCEELLVDLLLDYLLGLGGTKSEQGSELLRKTSVFFVGNVFPKRKQWDPDKREEMIYTNCNAAKKLDAVFAQLAVR